MVEGGGRSRQPPRVPARCCLGRYWDQRASSCVQEFWQPAHPPVSCDLVSKGLFVGLPVLNRFSGVDRASPTFRGGRFSDGANPGVARVRRVVWCVGRQPGRQYSQKTSSSVTLPPYPCADGVAHVVAIDKTRAERGSSGRTSPPAPRKESAARCRGTRRSKDSIWPRRWARAAVFYGCVSRWVFFLWRGRTLFSHRRPVWCTPYIA